MRISGITGLVMFLTAAAVIVFNACSSEAKSLKTGEIYQTGNGAMAIEVISGNQVEIGRGGNIILAEYGFKGDKLRVTYGMAGTTKVEYFDIVKEGLKDDAGMIFYSKATLAALAALAKEARKGAMAFVKGGCFDMGDTFGDGGSREKPVHRVCLDDFKMDKYEVTQAAYEAAMGKNPSRHNNCPDCPVEEVAWEDAKKYCEYVSKRLPTEAEWEYAAREGGKKVKYGTGKDEVNCDTANLYGCGGETKPVGSHAPNALGLYDMAGNVWEWTADWYDEDYYKKSPERNPKGPDMGSFRVMRGGSWINGPIYLRASDRFGFRPDGRDVLYLQLLSPTLLPQGGGFRCSQ